MEKLDDGVTDGLINELETKLSRLRAIYEQYFLGIERMPPRTLRKDVVRLIHRIENVYIRNTATKFKVRSLVQRFNSYKAYWSRVEREIENGTYSRDIRRAQRNQETRRKTSRSRRGEEDKPVPGAGDDGVIELNLDGAVGLKDLQSELTAMDSAGAFDNRPKASGSDADRAAVKRRKLAEIAGALGIADGGPKAPVKASSGAAAAAAARGAANSVEGRRGKLADIKSRVEQRSTAKPAGPDADARRVFNQLLEAKRRCNEPTEKISYASVAKSMSKQRSRLKEARGKDVEFKVVIKNGKAFIKPETK